MAFPCPVIEYLQSERIGRALDSTIGAATILLFYGGRYQLTPAEAGCQDQCLVEKPIPPPSWPMDLILTFHRSPFHGAVYAIVEQLRKLLPWETTENPPDPAGVFRKAR